MKTFKTQSWNPPSFRSHPIEEFYPLNNHVIQYFRPRALLRSSWVQFVSQWIDAKMSRGTLRCVSCVLLAVLAVLLADVCCEEQGKICGFQWNTFSHLRSLFVEHHTEKSLWFLFHAVCAVIGLDELTLLAITVATDETDGYKRFMRSAKANNIDVKVSLNYSYISLCV